MAVERKSVHRAVVNNLVTHFKQRLPSIENVIDEFPNSHEQLEMPCLSVSLGANPLFTPLDAEFLSKTTIVNNKSKVRHIAGMWDYSIQIDLWCRDKYERFNLLEELFAAINKDIVPNGLRLQMKDYYDVFCQYDLSGHRLDDSEASSQRSEWRATINLMANTRAVTESDEFIIQTIENKLETPDTEIVTE